MTKARDIMTPDCQCVRSDQTVTDAARMMAEMDVGALPICGEDDRLKGMITDRDIAIRVVAEGRDPNTVKVSEMQQGEAVTIGADDPIDELRDLLGQRSELVDDDHQARWRCSRVATFELDQVLGLPVAVEQLLAVAQLGLQ